MDILRINDLTLRTHIGVPEEERLQEQKVTVSIAMHLEARKAGAADDIAYSIDYERVRQLIVTLAQAERKTIERFAEDIAQAILHDFHPSSVDVTVEKFVLPETRSVSLTITRP